MGSEVAIWGAGEFGRYIYGQIKNCSEFQITCFVDNNEQKKFLEGLEVAAPSRLEEIGVKRVWIAVSDYYQIGAIFRQLHQRGIHRAGFFLPKVWSERLPVICDGGIKREYLKEYDISHRAIFTKLEYHVADHCNLNCRGCTHFSPIFEESFGDFHLFENDMKRLSELFANILRLRLMGGEPLLNPRLHQFIYVARKHFPDSCLEVVSNGLLVLKAPAELLKSMRENQILLQISLYPPTEKIREELAEFLEANGIQYSFGSGLKQNNDTGVIEEFHKCFTIRRIHSPEAAVLSCMGNDCHYLREGRISKCAMPLLIDRFNEVFGTGVEVGEEDYVDLYRTSLSPWEMVDRLSNPTPFCGYCINGQLERFSWENGNIRKFRLEDYIVEEELN